jgi:hypothetical protein
MTKFEVTIQGDARPQGSKRHVGNGRFIEASPYLREWRETVRVACLESKNSQDKFDAPVKVVLVFALRKPKNPKHKTRPASRPDLDKLVRAIFDSVTSAGIWEDDSLVVDLQASKEWADGEPFVKLEIVSLNT